MTCIFNFGPQQDPDLGYSVTSFRFKSAHHIRTIDQMSSLMARAHDLRSKYKLIIDKYKNRSI